MPLIEESMENMGVKCKYVPMANGDEGQTRLRVGGFDRRKVMFKGWVNVEAFSNRGHEGTFCSMQRDVVRPPCQSQTLLEMFIKHIGQSYIVEATVESFGDVTEY
jgi:hypothetical protein